MNKKEIEAFLESEGSGRKTGKGSPDDAGHPVQASVSARRQHISAMIKHDLAKPQLLVISDCSVLSI